MPVSYGSLICLWNVLASMGIKLCCQACSPGSRVTIWHTVTEFVIKAGGCYVVIYPTCALYSFFFYKTSQLIDVDLNNFWLHFSSMCFICLLEGNMTYVAFIDYDTRYSLKIFNILWAGEMAWPLRALTTLTDNPNSVLSAHNCL